MALLCHDIGYVRGVCQADGLGIYTTGQRDAPDDLRGAYPQFYWQVVHRYIGDGVRYLRLTQAGQQWLATLYAHVFTVEHASDEAVPSSLVLMAS